MPQLVYSMFMNVEIYYKRTRIAAIGAMIVSVFNVGASILLVPRIGYQAAAYISLMSYLLLAMIHYIIVRKMNIREVYDIRFILVIVASEIGIMFLMPIVYQYTVIRYSVLAALIVGLVFFAKKNWETVKAMLKK
jgi:O-antigen/teichoic acid export membrane protein